ncbi:MAG: nucleoside deaminase [Stellaceae bacterium]
MWSRRRLGSMLGMMACGRGMSAVAAPLHPPAASAIPISVHEAAMRLATAAARANRGFPFGAVIVRAADREVLAQGVNQGRANPTFHGEIVAINDYVARHGNQGWGDAILYTTGEPCPMCMSAMVWAGMGGVVFGTSIARLKEYGFNQILIPSAAVRDAASFYRGFILGHVLEAETDALFRDRKPG